MRGGPLTAPAPQVQLSQREREDPYNSLKGPSLLNRDKFGAKKTDGFKSTSGEGRALKAGPLPPEASAAAPPLDAPCGSGRAITP